MPISPSDRLVWEVQKGLAHKSRIRLDTAARSQYEDSPATRWHIRGSWEASPLALTVMETHRREHVFPV